MTENTSTVLITGASSGIGCELAKLFAKDHHNLVLIARSGPKLAQFADELQRHFGVSVKPIALDLATPTAPQLLFDQLRRDGIGVHVDADARTIRPSQSQLYEKVTSAAADVHYIGAANLFDELQNPRNRPAT